MANYIEKAEQYVLPVIPLRGLVILPGIPSSFEISDPRSIAALEAATSSDNRVFLSLLEEPENEEPRLATVGVYARIRQAMHMPSGAYRVLADARQRGEYIELVEGKNYSRATVVVRKIFLNDDGGLRGKGLRAELISTFEAHMRKIPKLAPDILVSVQAITDPGLLADFVAANILFDFRGKQKVLECFDPLERLELVILLLSQEGELIDIKQELHNKVREHIDARQREFFLREQMRILRKELEGYEEQEEEDEEDEGEVYKTKIRNSAFSDEIKEKLQKDLDRMLKAPYGSSESAVLSAYLDTVLEVPVGEKTKDVYSVAKAKKILDEDHDGLKKIKDRILEYIAVKSLSPELNGQILCLIGPPGVGKSSVAKSIARALGRKFVRVSLGGIHDEADIRGHRKTYIGAMPGRVTEALIRAKTMNPVVLLDEIDKLTVNSQGDPSAALLEVLDTEQNNAFRDHFLEVPIDLSDCIFIATANEPDTIPHALFDRMEIINLPSYTETEKISIFKNHLLPKQLARHALNKRIFKIDDEAIRELIEFYTKESGVRTLERQTAAVCRKIARKYVEGEAKTFRVTPETIRELLGARKVKPDPLLCEPTVGVVNGLAWTELGGEMLPLEVLAFDGCGKTELTGLLGDVMKESAQAAISYIRAHAKELGVDPEFYKKTDIHVHAPEAAIPKDGPSAGVTLTTALVSALSGRKVRQDIAMTGEVTLTGRVLPIGGLPEKTAAAYRNGIRTIFIPRDNVSDLEEVDDIIKAAVRFIPVSKVSEVLDAAIEPLTPKIEDHDDDDASDRLLLDESLTADAAKPLPTANAGLTR